jgi:hypothetical protein
VVAQTACPHYDKVAIFRARELGDRWSWLADRLKLTARRRRVLTCIKVANANAFHDLLQGRNSKRTSIPDRTIDAHALLQ